jgi:hypothetical protein
MKSFNLSRQPGSYRFDADQRAQLLAAFERSGLSGAAFARQQGILYTTFCGWRHRQTKARPAFVQVELAAPQPKPQPEPASCAQLVIELGPVARVRLTSPSQIALAVQLLHTLDSRLSS